ncbi:MAG: AsmA family protein [Candidatus Sulfotelmatobacter sp.]
MKIFSSKRRVAAITAVVLLLMFLLRPGASRLKSRVIYSISASVGRPVDVGAVHLQILPRPGFDLDNLVVYDDSAFGAEPMLRASDVTASLRLTALLRGRLEIARLNLTEPSLNLVHSDDGRWNLEALLERAAHIPLAPTTKAKAGPRPGFPYIEATSGRINFKNGPEKKPFALTNADFSLWQDSENTWGIRLKAQPVRTDLNLSDTGQIQVSGTWQRAPTFRATPMEFSVEWSRAQLGQLTKFFTGNDKGWRGAVDVNVALSGTPAKLRTSSSASIEDFRRYDITSGTALRLAGNCDAQYSSLTHEFHEVLCSAPVAQGLVTLTGDIGLPGSHRFAVLVKAVNVPASGLVALAQRAKNNLPDDLAAEGVLNGSFSMQEDASRESPFRIEGQGAVEAFRLASAAAKAEIGPVTLPLVLADEQITLGPMGTSAGHAAPTLRGLVSRAGYKLNFTGDAEIARTLRLARMIGIPALATTAEGTAQVDLQIAGSWAGQRLADSTATTGSGFSGLQVTGAAKLRNVQVTPRGAAGPVEILSAELQFLPDKIRVAKLNAKAAGTNWTGSLEMPRGCGILCPVHFSLNANQMALTQLAAWASPGAKKQPWYRVLNGDIPAAPGILASLHASGRVTSDRLWIRNVAATHVSANVTVNGGNLRISALEADFFGGTHRGDWQADFSVKPAVCKGSGIFSNISLGELAASMNNEWASGSADASYKISGKCLAGFWQSAVGTIRAEGSDMSFPRILVAGHPEGLNASRFSGEAYLSDATIEIKNGSLEAADANYAVRGKATLARELDLRLMRNGGASYAITGSLAEPRVAAVSSAEQARLKTEPK